MTPAGIPDLARYGIFTTGEAVRRGFSKGAIRHRLETGQWVALRRGFYVEAAAIPTFGQSRLETAAALGAMNEGAAASHWSAAGLNDVQTLVAMRTVWVTRPPTSGNGCHLLPGVIERAASLPSHHVTMVDGLPTTTIARTVIDIARMSTLEGAVVSMDSALRLGLTSIEELAAVARECRTWPGAAGAMGALRLANALAQSPLETVSRIAMFRMHLPEPELQAPFYDAEGLIGYTDFYWKKHRTVGEADGRMKYGDPQALWDEKRREDRLREAGVQVVRWSFDDMKYRPKSVHQRILAAFRRGDGR
jgi:putative AbiEi antitoxin of type IV toxin-antitoxin system